MNEVQVWDVGCTLEAAPGTFNCGRQPFRLTGSVSEFINSPASLRRARSGGFAMGSCRLQSALAERVTVQLQFVASTVR
jgi:hypothetical protein